MIPEAEKVDIAMEVVSEFWPQAAPYINEDAVPLSGIAWTYGLCTHPDVADEFWIHSRGGKKFSHELTLPESFLWVGLQDRGMSEAMFLMWILEGRRFWFYDRYFESLWFRSERGGWYEGDFVSEYEVRSATRNLRSRCRLGSALNRWRSEDKDVVYSGEWGWLDPISLKFQVESRSSIKDQQQLWEYTRGSSPYGEFVRRVYTTFEADASEFGPTFAAFAKVRSEVRENR